MGYYSGTVQYYSGENLAKIGFVILELCIWLKQQKEMNILELELPLQTHLVFKRTTGKALTS